MKIHALRWVLALLLAAWPFLPATAQVGIPHRAIWVWETESYDIVQDAAIAIDAIEFLRSKRIDTLYLYSDALKGRNLIESSPELYRAAIARLHGQGFKVYALLGSAELHTESYVLRGQHAKAEAMFRRVFEFNLNAAPDERFDGINFDIEPHMQDSWPQDREALLRGFLDMGAMAMSLKYRLGVELSVGPAIPFWWDGIEIDWRGRKRPMSEHVQDMFDYVALMDYRNRAEGRDGIISLAEEEMAYGQRVGKPVMVGVEMGANDIAKLTFHSHTEFDFEHELGLAARAWRTQPAFSGFVIHHYGSYRRWLGRPAPPR